MFCILYLVGAIYYILYANSLQSKYADMTYMYRLAIKYSWQMFINNCYDSRSKHYFNQNSKNINVTLLTNIAYPIPRAFRNYNKL